MKLSFIRPAVLLALALGLAACGGKASFEVRGVIEGLQYPGLVLNNNGEDLPITPPATSFSFPNRVDYGVLYNVTVKTQPAHQACDAVNGSDSAGRMASINIGILCRLNAYTIGGTVTGLTADGLVLTNGSSGGVAPVAKTANGGTTFTFGVAVPYAVSYGVTVLTQPTGLVCSVAKGTGVMGDAKVENIAVTCVPA